MKIATFNINNINRRLPNLLAWMHTAKPDVVALQELKASDGEFPAAAIEKAGYGAVWCGQKTWNGVAILARGAEPVLTRDRLPGKPDDLEARYIEAAVRGVIVTSIYLPNGNPQPGPKFDDKLDWFARLRIISTDARCRLYSTSNNCCTSGSATISSSVRWRIHPMIFCTMSESVYLASWTSSSHACGVAGHSRMRPFSAIFFISANLLVCQKSPCAWSKPACSATDCP